VVRHLPSDYHTESLWIINLEALQERRNFRLSCAQCALSEAESHFPQTGISVTTRSRMALRCGGMTRLLVVKEAEATCTSTVPNSEPQGSELTRAIPRAPGRSSSHALTFDILARWSRSKRFSNVRFLGSVLTFA
jgi:hypothetical protein